MRIRKRFLLSVIMLIPGLFSQTLLFSQVTISQSELLEIFTPGNSIYVVLGESGLINIGNTGGPNEYDFSYVNMQNLLTINNYDVSQIPVLAERYPLDATTFGESPQNIIENPILSTSGDTTYWAGLATIDFVWPNTEYRFVHYVPYEVFAEYPLTYSFVINQWVEVFDTTYDSNWQIVSSSNYFNQQIITIDGYGTLKLPGMELQCLRQKKEYPYYGYKEFYYLTRDTVFLIVTDVPLTEPDTGFVNADYQVLLSPIGVGIEDENNILLNFRLEQNYPNPFNPITMINYQLPVTRHVSIKVYDILGREITTLVDRSLPAGTHQVSWDAGKAPSGIYYYKIRAGNFQDVKKMVVMK